MNEPRYFVARFVEDQPYRVYGTRNYYAPEQNDVRCIWRGDDASEALQVMKKANEERRIKKREERLHRAAENRHFHKLEEERLKKFSWNRGIPKQGGGVFG
jgi:hypothetical protein